MTDVVPTAQRSRSNGRDAASLSRKSTVVVGDLSIDRLHGLVHVGRRLVHLTPKEFALLWTLATSPGKVFRREELLQEVWGNVHVTVRTVDTHMAKLRGKLRTAPDGRDLAETVWGVGYRLRNASS